MTNITNLFLGYHINEQIYAGNRTLVYRGFRCSNGQPVAIKMLRNDFPRFNELVHFRNQYIIAKNLEIPGSVKAYSLETYHNHYALVMEDFGGISLSSYLASLAAASKEPVEGLPVNEFLPIAIQIANSLDGLYRHHVIHKDLKPANILINPTSKEIKLIDFSIASLLPRETQEIHNPNVLEGTLPYISPEQTGRMNRGIDYRTDFYSLGVTFYELLTGKLPFQTDDPMDLVHCHLAKQPIPASIVNQNVPLVLSEIVSKLMAKNAEARYQSAIGLKYDLETCLSQWQETGELTNFSIGQRDLCDRFIIPEKLYGRESEVFSLLSAFERVSGGSTEMILVAGFSGIGKTAVVNEVHKPIVRQRGYFIKGKFDQFQRTLPFSAFVQAFRDLMGQMLSETDAKVEQWKSEILAALGDSAQVIVEVIPELERIIGQQAPVPELSGSAGQNRFNLLFEKFIQLFTTKEHPLVIFLDDLQWADSASLKLIQLLMSATEHRYLLLIGAYRDNEVFPAHPLMLTLADIQKTEAKVNTITLAPLDRADVNCLVADTLACSTALALPLTELVYQKTLGNPFFSTQFLKSLHEDGLIEFNFAARYWQCDIAIVRTLALTDDVVEFMALQLRKLPTRTQFVLKLAACIGNQFDLATLAIVDENSPVETATALWKALQEGLILPVSEVYKFYQAEGNSELVIGNGKEFDQLSITHDQLPKYKFLHDRVQQAAYSLIPDDQKRSTHLKIGQLLLNNTPEVEQEERIFDIVNHLNVGFELITQEAEREQLARLNLVAGKKAKAATAYSGAVEYFKIGRELLRANSWHNQYELTLLLYSEGAEAAFLSGHIEGMQKLVDLVQDRATSLLDKIKVYEVQMQAYMGQNRLLEAVNTGLQVLKLLGVEFPQQPTPSDIGQALSDTAAMVKDWRIEDLIDLPQMSEPYKLAAMRLLSSIFAAAYIAAPELLPLTVCKQVNLSVQYGNASVSPFAYANYGLLLCGVVGDIDSGYQFGQLALNLVSKLNAQEIKAKTVVIVNVLIRHWKEHLRETLEPLVSAYSTGMETGDLEYGSYGLLASSYFAYFSGKELAVVEREIARNKDAIHKIKQETALNYLEIYWQATLNMLGKSENPCLLKGEVWDEQIGLPLHQQAKDKVGVAYIYWNKLLLSYWFENYSEAIENTAIAEKYLDVLVGLPFVPLFYFYDSLVQLAVYADASQSEQQGILDRVQANQEKMQKWAHHAPMNYLHKFYLVEAERHRVLGEKIAAIEMYDKAIALAQENEYINEEALANELAAKFYLEWGKEKLAKPYLIDAYYAYAKWGAKAKIDYLEQRYPQLLAPILQQERSRQYPSETIHTSSNSESSLSNTNKTLIGSTSSWGLVDLPTVIKASQALSSEIQLDQLLTTLMQVVVKNAGAQTGALILNEEGNWKINVHCTNRQDCLLQSIPVEESEVIPLTLINYVKRTKETLVFDNGSTQPRFASDPHIIQQQSKSILCTPILYQGKMMGILYLENNLATGVFTRDRVTLLNILCSQAAISLQNAQLYQQSQEYAQKLELYLHDLKQMQLQLVQGEKMSALGNLVAGVAHEINNPVGFIAGNLQPAQEYVGDLFNLIDLYQEKFPAPGVEIEAEIEEMDLEYLREDLPKLISSMNEGVDRIRNISTSLRTFSRADSDRPVPFNIHDGLDSTLLILKHRLKASEFRPAIEVVKEYGNLPLVKCFPGQLNQVFMNVLANAIDALEESNKGRSFNEIKALPNQMTVQTVLSEDKNQVLIRIKDNGVGMSKEVKENIFNHLFTTKAVGQGTGLGLSIAHQIVVEKHGGILLVNSSLGQGSEFVISIPV
ncbi:ATP-binding sensor histidine kinase [Tychonema sp. LEGE 06208]|uniref:trifunctional serine/threonine-protein kinase/ATP-binding protein/sensor histidine kinase n=1 Tax=Tychonema sp. LEGE 06208 TaxID=1828663 RepID=UPI0018815D03|nr:ATP-binding sensor histidine kinase [Tychonema sp. LEGE 06208]MBE9162558.1 AAA family ATPase [Tychonema sp. LEGE 06208]